MGMRLTQKLFMAIIGLSAVHSLSIFDYNLPLFVLLAFCWYSSEGSRPLVVWLAILSTVVDCLFVLYLTKTFDLKRAFVFTDSASWNQSKAFLNYARASFSLNLLLKIFLLLWVVITKQRLKNKLTFGEFARGIAELLFLN